MSKRSLLLIAITIPFLVLSGIATVQHGYFGIFAVALRDTATAQVFCDLCIALLLVTSWIRRDAQARGAMWIPWIVGTLLLGSIAPLGYLLLREFNRAR